MWAVARSVCVGFFRGGVVEGVWVWVCAGWRCEWGVRVYVCTRVHTYVYDDVTYVYDDVTYVCTRVRTCTHARFRV